jgi:hypothetical protein
VTPNSLLRGTVTLASAVETFSSLPSCSNPVSVEILLKSREDPADLFGLAQIGYRIRYGVVVFEPEQRCQFILVELLHTNAHVVREYE